MDNDENAKIGEKRPIDKGEVGRWGDNLRKPEVSGAVSASPRRAVNVSVGVLSGKVKARKKGRGVIAWAMFFGTVLAAFLLFGYEWTFRIERSYSGYLYNENRSSGYRPVEVRVDGELSRTALMPDEIEFKGTISVTDDGMTICSFDGGAATGPVTDVAFSQGIYEGAAFDRGAGLTPDGVVVGEAGILYDFGGHLKEFSVELPNGVGTLVASAGTVEEAKEIVRKIPVKREAMEIPVG